MKIEIGKKGEDDEYTREERRRAATRLMNRGRMDSMAGIVDVWMDDWKAHRKEEIEQV